MTLLGQTVLVIVLLVVREPGGLAGPQGAVIIIQAVRPHSAPSQTMPIPRVRMSKDWWCLVRDHISYSSHIFHFSLEIHSNSYSPIFAFGRTPLSINRYDLVFQFGPREIFEFGKNTLIRVVPAMAFSNS